MKTNLYFIIILCTILLCYACGNSSQSSNDGKNEKDGLVRITITLPDMDTLQDIYLSEIADSVHYISLSEKPLLGRIGQMVTSDNSIILNEYNSSLKLYDSNGCFKREIGGIGQGSGEYIRPQWGVVRNTNEAYVHSRGSNSIQRYSLLDSNTKMIERIVNDRVFNFQTSNIVGVGQNIMTVYSSIFRYNKDQVELMLYNPKTNTIIDSLVNYNYLQERPKGRTSFISTIMPICFEFKDEAYYMNGCSDTLYRITEKEIAPFAIFDFGEYKHQHEKVRTGNPYSGGGTPNISIMIASMLRTSKGLYAQFSYNGNLFIYALNLDDLTGRYCKPYFINDLDNGPDYSINRSVNQIIDVATLKTISEEEENNSKKLERIFPNNKMPKKQKNTDQFQQLWDKSTEDSNPIIQVLKFKEY